MEAIKTAINDAFDLTQDKNFGKRLLNDAKESIKYLLPGYSSIKLSKNIIDLVPEKRNSYGFWDHMSSYFEQVSPILAFGTLLAEEYISSNVGWNAIINRNIESGLLYVGIKGAKALIHKNISKK